MANPRPILALLGILGITGLAGGQTLPATQPAVSEQDRMEMDAARRAVARLVDAMINRDEPAMREMFVGPKEQFEALMVVSRVVSAQDRLRRAARERLPDQGGVLGQQPDQRAAQEQAIERAKVIVNGGRAGLLAPDGKLVQTMIKSEGVWRVDGWGGLENIGAQAPILLAAMEAMDTVTEEVLAGKLTTVETTVTELQKRSFEAGRKMAAASSRPAATQPTTRP
jgi:hypothetical protein